MPHTIELVDLSKLDLLELEGKLPAQALTVDKTERHDDSHGELATATAIVVVSLATLRVIAVWAAKA
jgi:hypothetical protein